MKIIFNNSDTNIKGFLRNKVFWELKGKDTRQFPDEVADELMKTYPWLRQMKAPPKATQETIDEIYKNAEGQELKINTAPLTDMHPINSAPEGYDDHSIAGESIIAKGVPTQESGSGQKVDVDKDGVEWYGEGVVQEFFPQGKKVFK